MSNPYEPTRLIDFLYILVRDHLPTGTLESIMWDHVDGEGSSYCNTYVEDYVRDLAHRLLDDSLPITDWQHMYKGAVDHHDRWWVDSEGERCPAPYGKPDGKEG